MLLRGYLDILNTYALNADAEEVCVVFFPVQEELHLTTHNI